MVVLENTTGKGSTIGTTFQELKAIMDLVKDKSRVGVCLDTCHLFAAGWVTATNAALHHFITLSSKCLFYSYDVSTKEGYTKTMDDFGKEIGFQHLQGLHLNDSKGKFNCRTDRHENIGK